MSDPVTNIEIEDVLSSIRRLVIEGEKPRQPVAKKDDAPPLASERFVLTPSLRVSNAAHAPAQVDAETAEPDSHFADETAAVEDEEVAGFVFHHDQHAAEIDEAQNDGAAAFGQSDDTTGHTRAPRIDRGSLEATIAELEAAVKDQPDEWEPDGSEMAEATSWAAATFRLRPEAEDAEVAEPESDNVVADPEPVFHHYSDEAQDSDLDYDDDLIGGDDDVVSSPDDDLAAYLADTSPIDEDMLRQLVLEIVRDELQGPMGERITRNVRKLVRREIHRVLTSQDFD